MTLREKMHDPAAFLCGLEFVSTRGLMTERRSVEIRDLALELAHDPHVDWASITDNAGGNPMLSPVSLGKPILYSGKEVIIHLTGKDLNRSSIESTAWQMASEGFHNVLALSGDYPSNRGLHGQAKPVFDIDAIGILRLLQEMNEGLPLHTKGLDPTHFFLGAVVTNFKLHENEVIPQYLKLLKKIETGAEYVINQIGYDSRKCHELKAYLDEAGHTDYPLIGNVYLLNRRVARFFNTGRLPGVHVTDELLAECEKQAASPDKGRSYFIELAARQIAIFRGLGYRGYYLGGIENAKDFHEVIDLAASYGPDEWKGFAKEILYSRPGEFFYYAEDPDTGLCQPGRLDPDYAGSLEHRTKSKHVTWQYGLNKLFHDLVFEEGTGLFDLGRKVYGRSANTAQGPRLLRVIEHASKAVLFRCKDCGDCSLPDIAYLCPESQCAKNQRNGPCGGTRDGLCEVDDEFPCIWSRAYERLKYEGRELQMLDHAPVIQDQAMRGTSSWANTFLRKDHHAKPLKKLSENPSHSATSVGITDDTK
jgi:methylenetetrahydrofolate reductase (NADPH)